MPAYRPNRVPAQAARAPRHGGTGARAGAIALEIVSWSCRLAAIALCGLTIILCFSGLSAQLSIVGLVVDLSRALPAVIAGYGVITSPFGGVFRLDFSLVALALFVVDYACQRAVRVLR